MRRIIVAVAVAMGAAFSMALPAPAHASGPCLFQGDWDCYGPPQYNGPGQNTWDVPGTYGGWTTLPLWCPPGAGMQPCQQYIPNP